MAILRIAGRAAAALGMLWLAASAQAQVLSYDITVDENGVGWIVNTAGARADLPSVLITDPGPGGLPGALTYSLLGPPGLIAGDVIVQETPGGPISDLIRFNPNEVVGGQAGALAFYSDNSDGVDALADIGLPTGGYTNVVTVLEVGDEGNNGITYTPTRDQPGFVAGVAGPVTYHIKSDTSVVPEPGSTAFLAGLGVTGSAVAFSRLRRRK